MPIALLNPFVGICLYLWYSHSQMNDFVWPPYGFEKGATFLAVAILIGYFIFEMRRSPLRLKGLRLMVLLWIWLALSALFAARTDIAYWKIMQYSHIFVMAFLVAAMANSEERIRSLLYVMTFAVGGLGAKSGFDFLLTGGQYRMRGPGGLMTEENEYALAVTMGMTLLFLLANVTERRWLRYLMRAMALACGLAVLGTRSRSGFLGLAVAAILLTAYSKRKSIGVVGLVVAAVLFFWLAPEATLQRYEGIGHAAEEDASAIGRLQAWETGRNMIKAHPFLGVGLSNFADEFSHYSAYPPRAPHNAFVCLMAESGIPAGVLFTAMVLSTIVHMWRTRRRLRRIPGTETLRMYCLVLQITLAVYIVPNLFISRQNQDLMYDLLAVSTGVSLLARRKLLEQRQARPLSQFTPALVEETANV